MTSEEKNNVLKYKRFTKTAIPPYRAYTQSCGLDLTSDEDDVTIRPGQSVKVSTGLGFQLPAGTYGRLAPRSGLALLGIDILGGVIDQGFSDVVKCIIINHGPNEFVLKRGMRICQLILEKFASCECVETEELPKSDRRGGFGSSGMMTSSLQN